MCLWVIVRGEGVVGLEMGRGGDLEGFVGVLGRGCLWLGFGTVFVVGLREVGIQRAPFAGSGVGVSLCVVSGSVIIFVSRTQYMLSRHSAVSMIRGFVGCLLLMTKAREGVKVTSPYSCARS